MRILLAVVFVLLGCGKEHEEKKSEDFKYNFTVNGCATGEHSFSSRDDLCRALQDDNLNKGCAYSARKQMFQENCSGEFSPKVENLDTMDLGDESEIDELVYQ